jgi:hypothetical protein
MADSSRHLSSFFGAVIGAGVGNGFSSFGVNVANNQTWEQIISATVFNLEGGALGGFVGYAIAYFFDDPNPKEKFKTAFLFCFVFSLLIGGLMDSIWIGRDLSDHPFLVGIFAGTISVGLWGVANNLRNLREACRTC